MFEVSRRFPALLYVFQGREAQEEQKAINHKAFRLSAINTLGHFPEKSENKSKD